METETRAIEKSTETEILINSLDKIIMTLHSEINRTRRIKTRYNGVEPSPEKESEGKCMEPNGFHDTMINRVNTINAQLNELGNINAELENYI